MVTKSNAKAVESEIRESKKEYEQSQTRVSKLDTIIQKLYEDNVEGKISDERFAKRNLTLRSSELLLRRYMFTETISLGTGIPKR